MFYKRLCKQVAEPLRLSPWPGASGSHLLVAPSCSLPGGALTSGLSFCRFPVTPCFHALGSSQSPLHLCLQQPFWVGAPRRLVETDDRAPVNCVCKSDKEVEPGLWAWGRCVNLVHWCFSCWGGRLPPQGHNGIRTADWPKSHANETEQALLWRVLILAVPGLQGGL